MAPKSKSQIEADLCVELVKTHVPSLDGKEYEDENIEEVIACYQTLLCALAIHSQRVNSSVIQQAAKTVFGSNQTAAKRFGDAISHALSHCLRVGDKASNGTRLSKPLKRVYGSFKVTKNKFDDNVSPDKKTQAPKKSSKMTDSVTQNDAPVLPLVNSSSSRDDVDSDPSTAREIWKMYGFSPPKPGPSSAGVVFEVLSSQDLSPEPASKKARLEEYDLEMDPPLAEVCTASYAPPPNAVAEAVATASSTTTTQVVSHGPHAYLIL